MSTIYCHRQGCTRTAHGRRTASGRPLCERCPDESVEEGEIVATDRPTHMRLFFEVTLPESRSPAEAKQHAQRCIDTIGDTLKCGQHPIEISGNVLRRGTLLGCLHKTINQKGRDHD